MIDIEARMKAHEDYAEARSDYSNYEWQNIPSVEHENWATQGFDQLVFSPDSLIVANLRTHGDEAFFLELFHTSSNFQSVCLQFTNKEAAIKAAQRWIEQGF